MQYSTKKIQNLLLRAPSRRLLTSKQDARFDLLALRDNCAIGYNASTGNPALIAVVPRLEGFIGRSTEGLVLSSFPEALFRFKNRKWKSASVVIECRTSNAIRTFSVLAAELFD